MALNIRTVMTYPLDGSNVNFTITFEYLARKFITVTLLGTDRKELILNQDYRFTSKNQITLTKAWGPSDGYENIEVRRFTSATERLVDFADGSILRAYDLNISQVQTLHVAEEARDLTADTIGVNNDGNLDARGRRIVNLADGVDAGDAVTVRQQQNWADSALNQANRSKQEADRSEAAANRSGASAAAALASEQKAKTSENNAKVSEGNAKTSETNSKDSENSARASANAAKVSEGNAKTSETNAKASEDRAILEAGKLGNMNDFAATIKTVTGNDVVMKGKFSVDNGLQSNAGITYLNVNTATTTALRTQGDIEVYPPIGGQPNSEGGQIRLKGSGGGNTGGFIDVDSVGSLRVVKDGSGAGLKISFDTTGRVLVFSDIYTNSKIYMNHSGTAFISADGNITSPIYQNGSLHADLNGRTVYGNSRLPNTTKMWGGSVNRGGPFRLPMSGGFGDLRGRTIEIYGNQRGRYVCATATLSSRGASQRVVFWGDSALAIIPIDGNVNLELSLVTNITVTEIHIMR
ncbi:tail fiber protein [Yersinia phage fPS-54-ocr]|uniref:Tail fiber protein n=1 Tax=Yersinia phage fPS-54-ocr TaxID=2052753 RepID=A0A2H1UJE7_9CAUD|nr:tail fiber protein [Yersinia phage fPS-54-ocr]SOP76006.1 tail fiber protein [Yersinia phage fPS-54-ocr]